MVDRIEDVQGMLAATGAAASTKNDTHEMERGTKFQ
jgi:hypothetical protein